MMQIKCPWCGARDESEFVCGGESHVQRPGPSSQVTYESWGQYLFFRGNPMGINYERWRHSYGCGSWFNIARNTVTHEIVAVYEMTDPKPQVDAG